ncbi:MAG: GNAT family N-acetyltransferase [Eubacterium sp.]|nr:GNAT family N-acetyltransferase [Eubacterium sp.]
MHKIEFLNNLSDEGKAIRFKVFVDEQGFQNELDEIDNIALHLVLYVDGTPAGAARMFTEDGGRSYHLGRIAVLPQYRKLHLGALIVEEMCKKAKELGASRCELSAQCRVKEFYKKQGFEEQGDVYLDEYCPHIYMVKEL